MNEDYTRPADWRLYRLTVSPSPSMTFIGYVRAPIAHYNLDRGGFLDSFQDGDLAIAVSDEGGWSNRNAVWTRTVKVNTTINKVLV